MSDSFCSLTPKNACSHGTRLLHQSFCLLIAVAAGLGMSGVADAQSLSPMENGVQTVVGDTAGPDGAYLEGAHSGEMIPNGMLQPEPDWGIGADFGYSCPSRWYAQGDSFWLSREHDEHDFDFTLSREFELRDFDFEQNIRVTIGHTRDCLDGWEATYVGGGRWRETGAVTGTNLDSFLVPGPGFTAADFSAFDDAAFHLQSHDSELHSLELNRRWWGWEVFSVKVGGRIIRLDDEYLFFSQQPGGDQGLFVIDAENNLGLVQLGIDMMRPYGRLSLGGKAVGGIGINFNDADALIVNANDVKVNTGDDSVEFGFLLEAGVYAIYRVTNHLSLHIGYETWFLGELALATEQVSGPVDAFFGHSFDESDELLIHGGRAGVEFVW